MRAVAAGAVTVLLAACQHGAETPAITDGCYYALGQKVLRLAGDHADVLVPGDVRQVGLSHSWFARDVTLSPGVLVDVDDAAIKATADKEARNYPARPGLHPGFDLHVIAWGELHLQRGPAC